jgi:hypothetical protein
VLAALLVAVKVLSFKDYRGVRHHLVPYQVLAAVAVEKLDPLQTSVMATV